MATSTWTNGSGDKKYVVTWTNSVTITSTNLTSQWPIPTIKRALLYDSTSTVSWPAITRYFHIIFNPTITTTSEIVFKAVFAANSKTATVTRYNVKYYGKLADVDEVLKVGKTSAKVMGLFCSSTTDITAGNYGYISGSTVNGTVTFSNFPPTVNLGYTLSSYLNSVFGYVKGYCSATLNCTSQIGWTCDNTTIPSSTTAHSITNMAGNGRSGTPSGGTYQNALSLNATYSLGALTNTRTDCSAYVKYGSLYGATCTNRILIQDYNSPIVGNVKAERKDSDSTQSDVTVQYQLDALNKSAIDTNGIRNTITTGNIYLKYRLIPSDGSAVITGSETLVSGGSTVSSLKNEYTFTISNLNTDLSYTLSCWIQDRISTGQAFDTTISSEFKILDFKAGGTGISFGGAAVEDNLNIAMPLVMSNDIYIDLNPTELWDKNIIEMYQEHYMCSIDTAFHGSWILNSNGIYESHDSYHVASAWDTVKIIISGYATFSINIRSYAETNYDYVLVSTLDNDYLANCTSTSTMRSAYNNTTYTKATTRGNQSATSFTTVTFDNIDTTTAHYFYVIYQKDGSNDSNDDKGYFYIPEQLTSI